MGGPGEDLVTIFCDNGKVRISKFLLASLYTILKNIVQSLAGVYKMFLAKLRILLPNSLVLQGLRST